MATELPSLTFVSGASSGFGGAIVRRFARGGARVVASARRLDRLQALAREYPGQVYPLPLDIRDPKAMAAAIAALPGEWREIHCLINNAGLALGMEPAAAAKLEDWQVMIDTNCLGLAALTRIVLPGMLARSRGHIVNLGSVAGTYPYPGGNVYGATKAFVHQLTLNLRSDVAGTGVRVTSIEPGMCAGTEFSEVRFGGDRTRAAAVYEGMEPLTAEDIAETIEWAVTRPTHVNINRIELMPVDQSFGAFAIQRRG